MIPRLSDDIYNLDSTESTPSKHKMCETVLGAVGYRSF